MGFHDETDPALAAEVESLVWLHLGQLGALVATLRAGGADESLVIGKVPKTNLFADLGRLRPDATALTLVAGLRTRNDDAILLALADLLAAEGMPLAPQAGWAPGLVAEEGVLGRVAPSDAQRAEIAFALPVAKALGAVDVGQTVVVRERAVLALEAIEGTDEAIRRGAALGGPGAVVVKVAKPRQDPRFDVPTVGPETLEAMIAAKAAVLAIEAGRSFLLERDVLLARADACGIAIVGVAVESA